LPRRFGGWPWFPPPSVEMITATWKARSYCSNRKFDVFSHISSPPFSPPLVRSFFFSGSRDRLSEAIFHQERNIFSTFPIPPIHPTSPPTLFLFFASKVFFSSLDSSYTRVQMTTLRSRRLLACRIPPVQGLFPLGNVVSFPSAVLH